MAAITSGAVTGCARTCKAFTVSKIMRSIKSKFLLMFKILLPLILLHYMHLFFKILFLLFKSPFKVLLNMFSPLLNCMHFVFILFNEHLVLVLIAFFPLFLCFFSLNKLVIFGFHLSLRIEDHFLLVVNDSQPPSLHSLCSIDHWGVVKQIVPSPTNIVCRNIVFNGLRTSSILRGLLWTSVQGYPRCLNCPFFIRES